MRDDNKTLIIVAGGIYTQYLNSVEIYDPTDNNWHSGKANSKPQKNTNYIAQQQQKRYQNLTLKNNTN